MQTEARNQSQKTNKKKGWSPRGIGWEASEGWGRLFPKALASLPRGPALCGHSHKQSPELWEYAASFRVPPRAVQSLPLGHLLTHNTRMATPPPSAPWGDGNNKVPPEGSLLRQTLRLPRPAPPAPADRQTASLCGDLQFLQMPPGPAPPKTTEAHLLPALRAWTPTPVLYRPPPARSLGHPAAHPGLSVPPRKQQRSPKPTTLVTAHLSTPLSSAE